ncbi:MAG: glucosidase [Candidatus Eisenbacteria bacterium]|nr:glucosidase [Candidatus Eisenbacteria bacterium]
MNHPGQPETPGSAAPRRPRTDPERLRLQEDSLRQRNWKRWGPYLSERQWGTVREDYSADGTCWDYFPHDHARSRVYRWGEDGLLGICDREGRLCFGLGLWNGKDPILKERLFGLTGPEGNHGEDVKEVYFYLDSTPTHSYMKGLYKYPHGEYPYARLVAENRKRRKDEPEFELVDTGLFDDNRYFDVQVEYAKGTPDDVLIRITVMNRSTEAATLHLLPTLWFRNTWAWGRTGEDYWSRPEMERAGALSVLATHPSLGRFRLSAEPAPPAPTAVPAAALPVGRDAALVTDSGLRAIRRSPAGTVPLVLFTENETNYPRIFGVEGEHPYVKDAFHRYVIDRETEAINPAETGTKSAFHYILVVPPGGKRTVRLRLTSEDEAKDDPFEEFESVFAERMREADQFYALVVPPELPLEARRVLRQAYAGLLWSKQFYYYAVKDWLEGDPSQPPPPPGRSTGRNRDWAHVHARDVISMPDKWEYPWFAAWDLAFHMIPLAEIDPAFAKEQLVLLLREWYMHPNGQMPAYEFAFSDVNPPVHAWACWRVYKMTGPRGGRDRTFLTRVFQKLLINFTWWVNRKDVEGKHIFSGGFLGLDNIGVFDRSRPLPTGGHLEQADGTAWVAFYCATLLAMALELAHDNPAYEDIASKFFEHFVAIADAVNSVGGTGLWDEEDGFYYDQLHVDGKTIPLRVRSMVGLIPLCAGEVLNEGWIQSLPGFRRRLNWFLENRPELARHSPCRETGDADSHRLRLLAIPSREQLVRVLGYMLDEKEFLSPYGVRSLSRVHRDQPFVFHAEGREYRVEYQPGESNTGLFGGNSNWRGPIWLPLNYLLIEALERYHRFYDDSLKVECPVGSGRMLNLSEVAREISNRVARLFLPDKRGQRPCHGKDARFSTDPHWRDLVLFHEYFHGDTGRGLGASHQTGWTALSIRCLEDLFLARGINRPHEASEVTSARLRKDE